jgi:hypothetical protein
MSNTEQIKRMNGEQHRANTEDERWTTQSKYRGWTMSNTEQIQFLNIIKKQKQTYEWVSDCCLMPSQQFSAISWREQVNYQWDDDEVRFVLNQHADMSLHSDTLFWFRANQSLLFLLNAYSREATNTNFIVFGLTRPGLEPTIYHTRGEHANH